MDNYLECIWDIQITALAPPYAVEFDVLENITGPGEENLRYIENETQAEIVAAPQKESNKTLMLLCARHKTVEGLNRAVYLLERLQESVLGDLKHFIRKHKNAGPGVLELGDGILDTSKVFQCNLCAHAVGNQLEALKDHLRTADHLVKKASTARNGKQDEGVQSMTSEAKPVESEADSAAKSDIVKALSSLLLEQIKMNSINHLQGLVESDAIMTNYRHDVSSYPDSELFCKMCKYESNSLSDMRNHYVSNKHRFRYLNLQLMLGQEKFGRYYAATPLPGIPTNNGKALASKVVQSWFEYQEADKDVLSAELHQELHRRMMLYTGWINKGVCKACDKSVFVTWDGNNFSGVEWLQHVSGKNHAKACIAALLRKGKDGYQRDLGMTPVPSPSRIRAVLYSPDWMELSQMYSQMKRLSNRPNLSSDVRNKFEVPESKPFEKSAFGSAAAAESSSWSSYRDRSIHIRNYPENVTEDEVMSLFLSYGTVKAVKLLRDKKFGFVEFTEPSVVDYILREKIDSFWMQGRKLEINGSGRKQILRPKPSSHGDQTSSYVRSESLADSAAYSTGQGTSYRSEPSEQQSVNTSSYGGRNSASYIGEKSISSGNRGTTADQTSIGNRAPFSFDDKSSSFDDRSSSYADKLRNVELAQGKLRSQDTENLQPDGSGLYSVTFMNDHHFASFEEGVSAFMRFGLVKDYHHLPTGRTYVRYQAKESAVKAWKALKDKFIDISFPYARPNAPPPRADVTHKLNIVARSMGFLIDSEEENRQDLQSERYKQSSASSRPTASLRESTEIPVSQTPTLKTGSNSSITHSTTASTPTGMLVTGPSPAVVQGLPVQDTATRMLNFSTATRIHVNPTMFATPQTGAPIIAGLFGQPPPGYIATGLPGMAVPSVTPFVQQTPSRIEALKDSAHTQTVSRSEGDIGNIASSVQPQLEALKTAMAQKGVSQTQMAQLQQALNTIQSFTEIGGEQDKPSSNSAEDKLSSQLETTPWDTSTEDVDERRLLDMRKAARSTENFQRAASPPRDQSTGDIDERRMDFRTNERRLLDIRKAARSAGKSQRATTPPRGQSMEDIDERGMDERRFLDMRKASRSGGNSQRAATPPRGQTETRIPGLRGPAPWRAKQNEMMSSSTTRASEDVGSVSAQPPWARSGQQEGGTSSSPRKAQSDNAVKSGAGGVPPWVRQDEQEKEKADAFQAAGENTGNSSSPPWAKGQSRSDLQPEKNISQAPWKKDQPTEAPWQKGKPTEAPWKRDKPNEAPWKRDQADDAPWKKDQTEVAPWQRDQSSTRTETKPAPPWASQGKIQATVPPWSKPRSEPTTTIAPSAGSAAPWARGRSSAVSERSPPKTPWEAKRQSELLSKDEEAAAKRSRYGSFEEKNRRADDPDELDKKIAELDKKIALLDRRTKERDNRDRRHRRSRTRSKSHERRRRRSRSRSRSRELRRERSRDRDEDRYREREREDRERSRRERSPDPGAGWRRDAGDVSVPEENRFGRWATQEERKELTDADIVDKLSRATGLTNEILLHNITMKMKTVPPSAVYALSKCDGKVIQQLTVTGGAMVSPIMPVIQTLHQALGLARTQESYYIVAKIVHVFKEILVQRGKEGVFGSKPKMSVAETRWSVI